MCVGVDHLAGPVGIIPQGKVGLDEKHGIVDMVSQCQEPFCQLMSLLILIPQTIKPAQPGQHGEELRGLPHLLTELVGSRIGLLNVRSGIALGSD
jgi:hypothetical protein